MKKIMSVAFLVGTILTAKSQVLNSSFENLNSDGSVKNWGLPFMVVVILDTNGNSYSDSIVFDNQLYFSTSDAHSGIRAVEMRNAHDVTTNTGIAGGIHLTPNDSDYSAFAPMVGIIQRPSHFSFFYKFYPAGPDTAYAQMSVADSNGIEIGTSSIEITGTHGIYSQAIQPVSYSSQDPAAFVSIIFSTAKPGSLPTYGSRFLVDDVGLLATSFHNQSTKNGGISCFPNPVNDFINIGFDDPNQDNKGVVQIADVTGKIIRKVNVAGSEKTVRIETGDLARGIYGINYRSTSKIFNTTFVK